MIFKTITKDNFKKLVTGIIQENHTIAPVIKDRDSKGNPIFQFDQVYSFDEIRLDYTRTYSSLKNYFLPFRENLSAFHFKDKDWVQEIEYTIHPKVVIGARACDINALIKLDNVLSKGKYPFPYYVARRKNTIIIGLDHEPLADCFCRSLNDDQVTHGFNLFLTDLGEKYFMQIYSSRAMKLLENVKTEEITREDKDLFKKEKQRIAGLFKTRIDVTGLSSLMDIEFESGVWKKYGDQCLNCGSCAMVCPTCYCYTVRENLDPSLKIAGKQRMLYSCNLVDFAEVTGGHNFRSKAESRLKYRYYHQYRGFVESYDDEKCVGCNRCAVACPAGINPKDIINELRMEESV